MDNATPDLSQPPSSDFPSSPLSVLTRSPSISPRAIATKRSILSPPPSSIASGAASPRKPSDLPELEIHVNPDGAPPRKRRRVEPKPRTTQYLDLSAASEQSEKDGELLEQLTHALRKKKKVVVIAGAGISVSAGIPDFRSSSGLFATLPKEHKLKGSGKHLFDASVYKHDSTTSYFHTMVRDLSQLVKDAKPTPFHHLVASLSKEGRLLRLYTQNVDGIDTSMEPLRTVTPLQSKGPWPKTIQLHGGLEKMVCSKCSEISQFDASLFDGPQAPLCKGCVETDNVRTSHAGKRSHGIGRLRPRMVLYNEYNPDEEAIANVFRADLRARPDAVIVVGTSMKIPGVRNMVKDMCKVTRERRDGITAWINLDPEPSGADLKNCWDLVVRGKCDDVASLVHLPRYDESIEQGVETLVDDAKYESDVRRVKVEVEIRAGVSRESSSVKEDTSVKEEELRVAAPVDVKPQSLERVQGIRTPSASPRPRKALPAKPMSKSSQAKLSFASQPNTIKVAGDKPTAAVSKKAPKRKPKQAKKPEPQPRTGTINATFKATKSSAPTVTKQLAKRVHEEDPGPLDAFRDVLLSDFSLRPRQAKPALESVSLNRKDAKRQKQLDVSITRPRTPEQGRKSPWQQETVSPTSKPRGMGTLID
ncbi:DHS-like NAD/FAD-binding domain-containing protein [Xylariaceae sp. FL0594]|nr:DHS-like NAD/FAD-binding domain-containing protein [Xylariaceae sp. FL0594]